jgi:microcystin-dependent protein
MDETLIGTIMGFPPNFGPVGWMLCDGSLLPIAQHEALFSLIGTQFGGDGQSTFALPKIKPQQAEGSATAMNLYIAVEGIFPSRST